MTLITRISRLFRADANAVLDHNREHYTSDIAFNTQPGHIPLRARIIRQNDRAFESLQKAQRMQEKANSLRHVRVAGDAERNRQAKRDAIRGRLQVGMKVDTVIYGIGTVKRINKKTATITDTRMASCAPRHDALRTLAGSIGSLNRVICGVGVGLVTAE